MWKVRIAFLAYLAILTFLNLMPHPPRLEKLRPLLGAEVHFCAFAVLGVLVVASRFPWRPVILGSLLLTYAIVVELLQAFVPVRTFEARDLIGNVCGLLAGLGFGHLTVTYNLFNWRESMPEQQRFRVLTPEGKVTFDTFLLADKKPKTFRTGCVLLINEETGRPITVHQTRLLPVSSASSQTRDHKLKTVCYKCMRVEGIEQDEVTCPYHGGKGCDLLKNTQET